MPFNEKVLFQGYKAAILLSSIVLASACTFRGESINLVLKGAPAESSEVITLDPVFLSRQQQAETEFFGFESESRVNSANHPVPMTLADRDTEDIALSEEDEKELKNSEGIHLQWPVDGRITSPFGLRRGRLHAGIDIGSPRGTPIRSSASGQVLTSKRKSGYGLTVIVGHDHDAQTLYAHMLRMKVKEGEYVRAGQVIGFVGITGRSTGYHLHFETRVAGGIPQNPLRFLPKDRKTTSFDETLPSKAYALLEEAVTQKTFQR